MAKKSEPSAAPTAQPGPIAPGARAPAFKLRNQADEPKQLKDYKGSWLALYFYPKDGTPTCTAQARAFRDGMQDFTDRRVMLVGVSPDSPKAHARFAARFGLPFELLADPDHRVCEAYGVWQEKLLYGRKYMGVVRTTYLITPAGRIAHRWDRVKIDGHEQDVLAKLDDLQA